MNGTPPPGHLQLVHKNLTKKNTKGIDKQEKKCYNNNVLKRSYNIDNDERGNKKMKVRMFDTMEAYENWSDKKWEKNGCYDFISNCLCAVYKTTKFDDGTTWGGFDCDMEVCGVKKLSTAVKRFAKALREAGLISYAEYVEEYWNDGCVNTYTENGFAFEIEEPSDDTFYIRLAMVQNEMTVEADTSDFVIENGVLKEYKGNGNNVIIPDGVTTIGTTVFYGWFTIQQITIPDSVKYIGHSAFMSCKTQTVKSCYKAFYLTENGQLQCRKYIFDVNKEPAFIENIELCNSGYHYCNNLFDIFNFYSGKIDKDIAIYEIKPIGKKIKEKNSSKCCCQSFTFKKRLYREDVIRILNEGSINANI